MANFAWYERQRQEFSHGCPACPSWSLAKRFQEAKNQAFQRYLPLRSLGLLGWAGTLSASGHRGLQRAHILVSAQGRCGTGMLVPCVVGPRAISAVIPCRFTASGHQISYTRDQTGSLSRFFWQLGSFCQMNHNVEKGYKIQIGSCPPRFNGVLSTIVGPEQALVIEQEVKAKKKRK